MATRSERTSRAVSRRGLMTATALGLLYSTFPARAGTPELSVTEALRARRSTRSFADRGIDPALLALLLWAACEVNRSDTGLRTAPSWHGAADTVVHAATGDGVLSYAAASDVIEMRHGADIRAVLSPQPFVGTAPLCLIHISDQRRLTAAASDEEKQLYAQVDAAIIAQNVHLFAAALGLGSCLVGGIDRPRITEALSLEPHEFPAFVQPVGWPG